MENLNAQIDALLAEYRPHGHYEAKDKSWRDPVYAEIARLIPEGDARLIGAQQLVDRRETSATRVANRLLREIGRTGQLPLDWFDAAAHPISIASTRVRIAEATTEDFAAWSRAERIAAHADHDARLEACDGADLIVELLRANGWTSLSDDVNAAAVP
jgi:hypothetical protein